jgi:hypothetical protein
MRALDSSRSAVPLDLAKALAVFICCSAVLLTSCATRLSPRDAQTVTMERDYDPELLKHRFLGYEEVLRFLARREGLPHDRSALFQIAADSDLTRSYPPPIGELIVVHLDYRGESRFGIRGAQGQGCYYAFQVTEREWKLVGIFHGNRLRWEGIGDKIRVFVHWHTSAFDDSADDPAYVWNGQFFEYEQRTLGKQSL